MQNLTIEGMLRLMRSLALPDDQYKKLQVKLSVSEVTQQDYVVYVAKNDVIEDNTVFVHPNYHRQLRDIYTPIYNSFPGVNGSLVDRQIAIMLVCEFDQRNMRDGHPSILSTLLPPDKAILLFAGETSTRMPAVKPGNRYLWPLSPEHMAMISICPWLDIEFFQQHIRFKARPELPVNGYWAFYESDEEPRFEIRGLNLDVP